MQRRTRLHKDKKNPAQYPEISALTGHLAADHNRPKMGGQGAVMLKKHRPLSSGSVSDKRNGLKLWRKIARLFF
ncbi:MAG: hypothetical protein CSA32_00125 [Desulfobulbus propionicus]|nr:MAG: hypothetical protein CSA32_00125 [Desulfobulbus propionicus]